MKEKNRQTMSLFDVFLRGPEMKDVSLLSKALADEGVSTNPTLTREVVAFAQLKQNFLNNKRLQSKRYTSENLEARVATIKRVLLQEKRDQGYFSCPASIEFIERQLFVALIEKSKLISDTKVPGNIRSMSAFAFHLWSLKRELERQKITKPTQAIAVLLEKTNVLNGVAPPLER